MNFLKELQSIIKNLKALEMKYKMQTTTCKRVTFDTQAKFKMFLNDNFEITNDDNDKIFCSDFTRFCIRHYEDPLTSRQIEAMMNQIIPSKNKRLGNKIYKMKFGIKPKKLDAEFRKV